MRERPKTLQPPLDFQPGQAWFRLLCRADTAGGVIGNCGMIVRRLESQTGARIHLENTIAGCLERVINVFGCGKIGRMVTVEGNANGGLAEESAVSKAQEALLRVFERILEVERINERVIICRLVSGFMNIGHLMGKGGKTLQSIQKCTGAKIKILPKDQLPQCASPSEELIQIFGDILAVKKALLAVAYKLQESSTDSCSSSNTESSKFNNNNVSSPLSSSPMDNSCSDFNMLNSLSDNAHRILRLDDCRSKIVFRLLCPVAKVGNIIGKGATIVRALEKETGASIRISPPQRGCNDRVATISAVENEKDQSPAQTALLRVFSLFMEELDADKVSLSSGSKKGTVTASILVPSELVTCCLTDNVSEVSSPMSMQVLERNLGPHCTEGDKKIVQIIGEYENVKKALFRVTSRLRHTHFANLHNSADLFHHDLKMREEMDNVNRSTVGSNGDQSEYTRTVKVVVPNRALDAINSNLTRIKQISGVNVLLQSTTSNEKEGIVVISGMPHGIQVAESLVQAFILTEQ